ncbi:hypothetical protein [Sneathiella litorea]|uniref:hypothetical protein n=1 Tax=Sneathiella litorea TaxID=2606216 RepID=UPI0019258AAA|nr:hypothetical protein [Sneathiella litorea]
MTDTSPGKIEGVLRIRNHQADVRIDYSLISYSITYASSVNLLANGYGIHRNYNQWIRDLEAAINVKLLTLANTTKNEKLSSDDKTMLEAWKRVQNSNDPLPIQEFMDTYSDGPFIGPAQDRLDLLAQRRVSGVKTFDPTGNWQVIVRYQRGPDNISACPKSARWSFILDFRRGKFSNTYWDGNLPLYLTGENYDDLVDLKLNGPLNSGEFEWKDRFKINSDEEWFEASANGACPGIMKLHMKKADTVGDISGASGQVSENYNGFDPTGTWQVFANYKSSSGASASCIQNVNWSFPLDFHRGIISKAVYSGRTALHLNGENNPGHVDLQINVPAGGTLWRWTERFVLDGPDKFFRAESPSGGGHYGQCHGVISMRMQKTN